MALQMALVLAAALVGWCCRFEGNATVVIPCSFKLNLPLQELIISCCVINMLSGDRAITACLVGICRCLGILLQPQPSLREGNQKPMENRPWESGRSGNFFPFPRKKMAGHINSAMLSNWTQHCLVYSATLAHCLCREFVVEHSEVVYIVE